MMAVGRAVIRIDVVTRPAEGECPVCGFDALLEVTGYHLGEHGVSTVLRRVMCGRCVAEAQRGAR